jgi:hypothetical protein
MRRPKRGIAMENKIDGIPPIAAFAGEIRSMVGDRLIWIS